MILVNLNQDYAAIVDSIRKQCPRSPSYVHHFVLGQASSLANHPVPRSNEPNGQRFITHAARMLGCALLIRQTQPTPKPSDLFWSFESDYGPICVDANGQMYDCIERTSRDLMAAFGRFQDAADPEGQAEMASMFDESPFFHRVSVIRLARMIVRRTEHQTHISAIVLICGLATITRSLYLKPCACSVTCDHFLFAHRVKATISNGV